MLVLFIPTFCSAQYRILDDHLFGHLAFEEVSVQEIIAVEKEYQEELILEKRKSQVGAILEKTPDMFGSNCVSFVRARKFIPQRLLTLSDKKSIINTTEPQVGAVVITQESWYGHLSLVVEVKEDTIVIEDGNYIHGYRTIRVIDKDFPIGYYL